MRSTYVLFSLLTALVSFVVPSPLPDGPYSIDTPRVVHPSRSVVLEERASIDESTIPGGGGLPTRTLPGLTNAKRLARGLPIVAPKRMFNPTAVRRQVPSSVPIALTGNIRVNRADNGDLVGYVADTFISPAISRYGITTSQADALVVTLTGMTGTTVNQINILATNGPDPAHPDLGWVVGPADNDNDLSSGSYNYLLLTGTSPTAAGSPPAAAGNSYDSGDSESAVWSFDDTDNAITTTWINTNGAAAPSTLWYLPNANGLVVVGDSTAFSGSYPGGYAVTYTLVV